MGLITNRTRIQNAIIDLVNGLSFFRVKYDKDTGYASIDDTIPIKPKTLLTNEIQSNWSRDPRYGQGIRNIKTRWTFELLLGFNCEVTLEYLEAAFETSALSIPADNDNGFKQAILELSAILVEHPAEQSGAPGTKARITLTADLGRQ